MATETVWIVQVDHDDWTEILGVFTTKAKAQQRHDDYIESVWGPHGEVTVDEYRVQG